MDGFEATKIVFSRIQNLDPENASKIMGLLLLQDHGEKEMSRLAFGPESLVHSVILKAHKELGLGMNSEDLMSPNNLVLGSSPSMNSSSFSPYFGNGGSDSLDEFQLQDQLAFLNNGSPSLVPKNSDLFYPESELSSSPNNAGNPSSLFPSYGW